MKPTRIYLPTFFLLFIESHYKTVTTALIQEQCFSFLSLYHRDHQKILYFWDRPYTTSAKGLGGWGQKNGIFLLTFRTIYVDVGWVGQKKSKNVLI